MREVYGEMNGFRLEWEAKDPEAFEGQKPFGRIRLLKIGCTPFALITSKPLRPESFAPTCRAYFLTSMRASSGRTRPRVSSTSGEVVMDHRSTPPPTSDSVADVPPEYAITRRYLLPAGSAVEFLTELEDETEEPTPALRALLRRARR